MRKSTTLRASSQFERNQTILLRFQDEIIEAEYIKESWMKSRFAHVCYIFIVMLTALRDWYIQENVLKAPLVVSGICFSVLTLTYVEYDQPYLLRKYAMFAPIPLGFRLLYPVLSSMWIKNDFLTCPDQSIPLLTILLPMFSYFGGYSSPASFSDLFIARIFLTVCGGFVIMCSNDFHISLLIAFFSIQMSLLMKLYQLEAKSRRIFYESHLALKSLKSLQLQGNEEDMTLVRNAMRLTFPENPFHDAATEARIEKVRLKLQMLATDGINSENLIPSNSLIPLYYKLFSNRIRGIKMARFKHEGDDVIVHSIPNLDTLETEQNLENFMKVISDASNLKPIPGLVQTIGYCLTPCTFVVEDILTIPSISFRDLQLQLGAEELKLDWFFFKPLAACLAKTLSTMHSEQVFHRRISLDTIYLTKRDSCTLLPVSFHQTFPEVIKKLWGTSGWEVAPEIKESSNINFTEASDVWALCVVAWEMLVGPFNFQVTPFAIPATVPKEVRSLILDGLSTDPDGRPKMFELYQTFSAKEEGRESSAASADCFARVLAQLNNPTTTHHHHHSDKQKVSFDE